MCIWGYQSHNKYMHYVSFLAVEADNQEQALAAAHAFMEGYENHAYDWYVVGGRWSGACGGSDLVCAGDSRSIFDEVVERAVRARDQSFNEARQHLFGPDPRVEFSSGHGEDGEDDSHRENMMERIWGAYRETSNHFTKIINGTSVPELRTGEVNMIGYYLRRLSEAIDGSFGTHSYFYDTVAYSNGVAALYDRVAENPDKQWIVTLDLHN